jgi:GT2 family glycosyltransferase
MIRLLEQSRTLESSAEALEQRIRWIRHTAFLARYPALPAAAHDPNTTFAAVDRAYPLGEQGLLIFGWHFEPRHPVRAITVQGGGGQICDVTDSMLLLARHDVSANLQRQFPMITEWCGFVCLVPLPTNPGEERALCFDFGEHGESWLKIPTDEGHDPWIMRIKNILSTVPALEHIRARLLELFERHLGPAIESISCQRPPFAGVIEQRQFGSPPENPAVSIIVPLYGRYDFLRHQMAHFADDPDFQRIDLIYVVDDPSILAGTHDLAAACHPVFGVPFRIVSYGSNLGFAGANNVGARVALADTLLLLNSDVIPEHSGWVEKLRQALDELPQAGAVGPLLKFCDDSIQHAGMVPKRDEFLPGFLLNIHPGKGRAWTGSNTPFEPAMLTAACLMLKREEYLDMGGLDEGYVIGDFEDSDLCLALRKRGKRLWLVPEAKLWHLERQSQNLGSITGYRFLLTLFNGWRYQKKIQTGLIADPTLFVEA